MQDAEDMLSDTQQGMRDYLLENDKAVKEILADTNVRIGSSFINAIASSPTRDEILVIFDDYVGCTV